MEEEEKRKRKERAFLLLLLFSLSFSASGRGGVEWGLPSPFPSFSLFLRSYPGFFAAETFIFRPIPCGEEYVEGGRRELVVSSFRKIPPSGGLYLGGVSLGRLHEKMPTFCAVSRSGRSFVL